MGVAFLNSTTWPAALLLRAMDNSWTKAKGMILDALTEVERLSKSTPSTPVRSSDVYQAPSQHASSSSSIDLTTRQSPAKKRRISAFEEHKKIFGFKHLDFSHNRKGKRSKAAHYKKKKKVPTYTKDTICLKFQDQTWLPSTEERIKLSKLGLGLKKLVFEADGDPQHIHDIITSTFPVLECCGGYTLMRLKENSRDLVPIDGPDGGITVPFLKDILRQAKLFVCPLQSDVTEEDAEKFCSKSDIVSIL